MADDHNSYSGSLASSAIWSGSSTSTLGVAGIQVSMIADKNFTVWVEQSPDSVNWDISDSYNYYLGIGNFGITVQSVNSYTRVRIQNIDTSSASLIRLQTALCPIVEALPRSLSCDGNLKVAIEEMSDEYGFEVENTPNDEMRVVTPYRLVGATFSGSTVDSNFWTVTTGSVSGSVVGESSQIIITTGSATNGASAVQSFRTARYIGGTSHRVRFIARLPDTGASNNIRRWGAFTSTDGCFFELNGTTFSVGTRKNSSDLLVSSGSFNGHTGITYTLPIIVKIWEIYWNNGKVYFTIDGELIHTVAADTTTWSDTMHLPVRIENTKTSGSGQVNMFVRQASIHRLGNALSQPTGYYFAAAQTAGVNLKIGPGNLHSLILSNVTNNAVITLSDSLSAITPTLFAVTAGATAANYNSIDFMGMPFFTGLRLTVTSANAGMTVIYE